MVYIVPAYVVLYLLLLFNATKYFNVPIAIITLGIGLLGITLGYSSTYVLWLNRVVARAEERSVIREAN